MSNLVEKINLKAGEVEGAHVMKRVNMGMNAYGTAELICADIEADEEDLEGIAVVLSDFCSGLNEDTGYTVSVWFD